MRVNTGGALKDREWPVLASRRVQMIPRSVAVIASVLVVATFAQQPQPQPQGFTSVPQCKCSDIEACSSELTAKTEACKNNAQCTGILSSIGDSNKIRKCLDDDHAIMIKLETCAKKKLNGELGCTNAAVPQNLTIPLIPVVEVPSLDEAQGTAQAAVPAGTPQGPPELGQYLMCVDQCSMADMEIIPGRRKKRSPVTCAFKLKCALAPPDEKIQKAYTDCEKELKIDPEQRMSTSCNCLKGAGVAVQC